MIPLLAQSGIYWHLPILVILVSLIYSATRYDEWDRIFHYTFRVGLVYIIIFMGSVFLFLFLLSSFTSIF